MLIVGFVGETAIDISTGDVMVSASAGLVTLPRVTVMLHIPVPTPEAKPPAAMPAIEGFEEAHATLEVRFCVLELLYVPMAVNC